MKNNYIKFKDLSNEDKKYRIANFVLMIIFALAALGCFLYYVIVKDPNHRTLVSLAMILVFLAPWLVELIFRTKLPNIVFMGCEIYAFFSGFLGSVISGYMTFSWYDDVIHTLAGYVLSVFGLFVISKLQEYKTIKPWLVIVFCFCFSMAGELLWELWEWAGDVFFGQTAQGSVVEGLGAPLVTDTMSDILCNFCGALIFMIQMIIGKFSKFSFGIKAYENNIVTKKNINKSIIENNINNNENNNNENNNNENNNELNK